MDASFFSKPLSQLECRDNKISCHLLEKKGTHPMKMHDNNTTCNRSNQNAGFLDTTNTTCNRSNQNARLPDTHSRSTNQHPAAPDNKNHVLLKHGTMLKSIPCYRCLSVHKGEVYTRWADTPQADTPPRQTPLLSRHPS